MQQKIVHMSILIKTLLQDVTVTLYMAVMSEPDFRRPVHSVMVPKYVEIKIRGTAILPAF